VTSTTSYLGTTPGSIAVPDLAAPARRHDLAGLPPAWIGIGALDLFYDEDLDDASRLREAGVECEVELVDGAFHGFDTVKPGAAVTRRFRDVQLRALSARLAVR
jgi:acetyl esterase/lipase